VRYVLAEITLPLVGALVVGVALGRWLLPRRPRTSIADTASQAASDAAWVRELADGGPVSAPAADDDVVLDALDAPPRRATAPGGSEPHSAGGAEEPVSALSHRLEQARAEIDDLRWRIRERDALVAELRGHGEHQDEGETASTVDDLTLVWGVTPDVAEVLRRAGIDRLAQLGTCSVEQLRALLDDAGEEYATVDPSSWPRQAALWAGRRPG
jgi:predicted flap endonuclease-1-like 5' DNA nuclease